MDINQKDRTALKAHFIKHAMPSEQHFAELIDGMLNQKDDRIVKPVGSPLSLEASGDAASRRQVLHLYEAFDEANPAWTLSMNPRSVVSDPATARRGFSIDDSAGVSRLFIDYASGNVGVGTVEPQATLHVMGAVKCTSLEMSVTAETWVPIEFESTWRAIKNTDGAGGPALFVGEHEPPQPSYCKDRMGWVHLRGCVLSSSGTPPEHLCTLSTTYRPEHTARFAGHSYGGQLSNVTIRPDGKIMISANATGRLLVSLDNCHFKAFQ